MRYDMVVTGGHVIDPAAGIDGPLDVAIWRGRVAAVDERIDPSLAWRVVDVGGDVVAPGFIDLHTHVFAGVGYFSVDPAGIAWRSGVTTWVDAGSSGAFTFPGLRRYVIDHSQIRVLGMLAISWVGTPGLNYDEYAALETCDPDVLSRVADAHRDVVVGIKVRMGSGRTGYQGLAPLQRALTAADRSGLPLMVHIAAAPPAIDEVVDLLRPGDVLTHAFTGQSERIIDEHGAPRAAVTRARDRGVLFDIGHGSGSFSFRVAESLTARGFFPDTISTDLHWVSLPGPDLLAPLEQEVIARVAGEVQPRFMLPTAMTKLLHLGMPLTEVVAAVTSRPATWLGRLGEIGTLRPGAHADIATFRLDGREVTLHDIHGEQRHAATSLVVTGTYKDGRRLPPTELEPPPPWIQTIAAIGA